MGWLKMTPFSGLHSFGGPNAFPMPFGYIWIYICRAFSDYDFIYNHRMQREKYNKDEEYGTQKFRQKSKTQKIRQMRIKYRRGGGDFVRSQGSWI